ncbi:MAG: class I SAM-dependent methyltransferase [archaeon]
MENPLNDFSGTNHQADISLDGLAVNDYDAFAPVYREIMGRDYAKIIGGHYWGEIAYGTTALPKLRCLDLACGTGDFGLELFRRSSHVSGVGIEYLGIDKSNKQIELAKERETRDYKSSVKFRQGNVLRCKLPQENDAITMNLDALNHLTNPGEWYILFYRVNQALKPGGAFLFDMNTQERILKDWDYPEVIVKPGMTYTQISSGVTSVEGFVKRRLYMEVHSHNEPQNQRYRVLVEQIAPSKDKLFEMLRLVGFGSAKEIELDDQNDNHVFLKNRMFVEARLW